MDGECVQREENYGVREIVRVRDRERVTERGRERNSEREKRVGVHKERKEPNIARQIAIILEGGSELEGEGKERGKRTLSE